jgi:hypothetical protein
MGSVLDGFLFGAGVGEDDVVVGPVIGNAGDLETANCELLRGGGRD